MSEMKAPYWVLIDYGGYEGIRKHAETESFDEAVRLREEAGGFGSPVYLVQVVPLEIRDGRNHKEEGR